MATGSMIAKVFLVLSQINLGLTVVFVLAICGMPMKLIVFIVHGLGYQSVFSEIFSSSHFQGTCMISRAWFIRSIGPLLPKY